MRSSPPSITLAPIVAVLAVLFLVLSPAIGCAQFVRLSPRATVAKAYAAMAEVNSFRAEGTFKLISQGETREWTFEMEFVDPDRIHKMRSGGGDWNEFIMIGDAQYFRSSQHPDWHSEGMSRTATGAIVSAKAVAVYHLKVLDWLVDIEELPGEEIGGVNCWHYRGRGDMAAWAEEGKAKLNPSQPEYEDLLKGLELQAGSESAIELWIGKHDYLIRQIEHRMKALVPRPGVEEGAPEEWVFSSGSMRYFDFNQPIQIEPPL